MQHLIVPIDGSVSSWRAFDVAHALAVRCDSDIRLVQVEFDPFDGRLAVSLLNDHLVTHGPSDVDVVIDVRVTSGSVASEIDKVLRQHPGSVAVMASHGKGRSAAIVGSTAEQVLRRSFGPVVLVGPQVRPDDFSGDIVVTVDGSAESEVALPLAAAWAIELRSTPWVVHVASLESSAMVDDTDVFDACYPARLAEDLHAASGHPVQFEELHGPHPAVAVCEYANRRDVSLIVASSHGRGGLSRLVMGSVASGLIRAATCPVLVARVPNWATSGSESHASDSSRRR